MRFLSALAIAGLLLLARAEPAGAMPAGAEPGDEMTVYALTFGPGSHPFFKFGHNAILVETGGGDGLVYNFGTFQFDSWALIPKFLRGRFNYWLSVSSAEATMASYIAENRTIVAQELDLTAAQKRELARSLRENSRPENREYLYDYFLDNCSTRVRDALDRVLGGRIKQAGQRPAAMSFREHALRMTADLLPEYLALHLGLGSATDSPITLWEESFLPERLHDLLREVRIPGQGGDRPLVRSERVLFAARRPTVPAQPPSWTLWLLAVGTAAGGALAGLGRLRGRGRGGRIALGVLVALLGLLAGLLGLILTGLWAFTDHRAAHANANITLLAPWAIALTGYGIGVARGRPASARRALWVAATALAFALFGLLLKLLPGPAQDNVPWVALLLPIWIGMAAGLAWASAAPGVDRQGGGTRRARSP
jgi:hypothetical protein